MVLSGEELLIDEFATGVIHGIEAPLLLFIYTTAGTVANQIPLFSAHKPPTPVTAGRQKVVHN
jgi:hypothetical protein